MSDHNYGINDYEFYSKDPEWKALHEAVFGVNNKRYYMPESYSVDDYHFLNTNKHYDAFMHFYNNDEYSAIDRNDATIVYIDPSNIEGIPIYSKEAKDPCGFWQIHKIDGTLDSFIHSITDYVPEVHNRLEAGQNLSDIEFDDRLSACVSLYFQDAVQVDEVEGKNFMYLEVAEDIEFLRLRN